MLQKQVYLYSLNTSDFFNENEKEIFNIMLFINNLLKKDVKEAVEEIKNIQKIFKKFRKNEVLQSNIKKFIEKKEKVYLEHISEHLKLLSEEDEIIRKLLPYVNNFLGKDTKELLFLIKSIERAFKELKENKILQDNFKKLLKKQQKSFLRRIYDNMKLVLKDTISQNTEIRTLNNNNLKEHKIIAIFENSLTRIFKIEPDSLTTDIFVIEVYHTEVLKDLIFDGFMYNNKKYVFFTASSGQTKDKKITTVEESKYLQYKNTIFCGINENTINTKKVNVNKYLAYLALNLSGTTIWENFDIDECIVVDDMNVKIKGVMQHIDDENFKINKPEEMELELKMNDGCGFILSDIAKKAMVVRLPWIKGLLVPYPFLEHAENAQNYLVTDIYNYEWDLRTGAYRKKGETEFHKDENTKPIKIIFSKSMFKMWKHYKNWLEYKDYFKKYDCLAGICNEEPDEFYNKKINYQMLQTLRLKDWQIDRLIARTVTFIKNAHKDKNTMLKVLGVKEEKENLNYLQQALSLYPALLQDKHCMRILKETIDKRIREAKAGRLILNSRFTYIAPDMYRYFNWLLGEKDEILLENGEIYCNLFDDGKEVAVLRSPHLSMEWAVRKNVTNKIANKKNLSDWFVTNCLYVSSNDLISRLLMYDHDGDCVLVVSNGILINAAKKQAQPPTYYVPKTAEDNVITKETIYKSLLQAYEYNNVGIYSNIITKIWNQDKPDYNNVKIFTMLTNYDIDATKTGKFPEIPPRYKKLMYKLKKAKKPYFFKFAKKDENTKNETGNGTVDKICKKISEATKELEFDFSDLDKYYYNKLMCKTPKKEKDLDVYNRYIANDIIYLKQAYDEKYIIETLLKWNVSKKSLCQHFDVDLVESCYNNVENLKKAIYQKYIKLNYRKRIIMKNTKFNAKSSVAQLKYRNIREELLKLNDDIYFVVNVLLEKSEEKTYKTTLFEAFGDIIVENINENVNMICKICGKATERKTNNQKYCPACAKTVKKKKSA